MNGARFALADRMIEYIGYLAGALTVFSYSPQVVKAWRTKEVKDLSFAMIALLLTAGATWIVYGITSKDLPVIATNVGTVSMNAAMMAAKVKFK